MFIREAECLLDAGIPDGRWQEPLAREQQMLGGFFVFSTGAACHVRHATVKLSTVLSGAQGTAAGLDE